MWGRCGREGLPSRSEGRCGLRADHDAAHTVNPGQARLKEKFL